MCDGNGNGCVKQDTWTAKMEYGEQTGLLNLSLVICCLTGYPAWHEHPQSAGITEQHNDSPCCSLHLGVVPQHILKVGQIEIWGLELTFAPA